MPNWNSNYLTVKGFTPAEQSEFKEKVEAEELFTYYHPIPEELEYSVNVVESIDAQRKEVEGKDWWSERTEEQREEYLARFKERKSLQYLIDKYGEVDGYNWCIKNWGTKWDMGDPVIGSEDSEFTCYFSTAWSPPVAAFEEISKRFPNATFELSYEEQGSDFTGAARFKSGVVEEFDGLPPSELKDNWLQENHPELVGNEDREDEVWELWSDAYKEVVENHLAELLGSEPLSADVIQARKESEEQAKELFERMLQDLKAKQTT